MSWSRYSIKLRACSRGLLELWSPIRKNTIYSPMYWKSVWRVKREYFIGKRCIKFRLLTNCLGYIILRTVFLFWCNLFQVTKGGDIRLADRVNFQLNFFTVGRVYCIFLPLRLATRLFCMVIWLQNLTWLITVLKGLGSWFLRDVDTE